MVSPPNRFPQITDTGDHILLVCDCKSQAAVTAAGGVFEDSDSGNKTFSEGGVTFGGNNISLNFTGGLTAAEKTKMERGFTMTFWIESGWFANSYTGGSIETGQEYLMGCYNSSFFGITKANGSNDIKFRNSASAGFSASSRDTDDVGRGEFTRVDLFKIGGLVEIYLDYFPFIIFEDGAMTSTPFNGFIGIGASQFGDAPQGHAVKDFMITTNPFKLPVNYGLTHVCAFGHSYVQQGDYPVASAAGDGISALSYSSSSSTVGSGGLATGFDLVMTPAIHKNLNKANIGIGNQRIFNHAKGGMKLSDSPEGGLAWQILQGITNHSNVIDTAIIMCGANEVTNNAGDWVAEYGASGTTEDWETLFQTEITKLIALGSSKILLINQPYLSETHPVASGQAYRDRVDGCNTMIDSLVSANSQCYLVNANQGFGANQVMWGGFDGTDQTHPSILGSSTIANLIANRLLIF